MTITRLSLLYVKTTTEETKNFFAEDINKNNVYFMSKKDGKVTFIRLDNKKLVTTEALVITENEIITVKTKNSILKFTADDFISMYETVIGKCPECHKLEDVVSLYNKFEQEYADIISEDVRIEKEIQEYIMSESLKPNEFYYVNWYDYEGWDKVPDWYKGKDIIQDDNGVHIKMFYTEFYSNKKDFDNRMAELEKYASIEYVYNFERAVITKQGKYQFSEDFIREASKYSDKISSGIYCHEFAFSARKELRKEAREVLTRDAKNKYDKNMRLSYIRQYI